MKPTIYLHIGLYKTGSTSIQATLFRNRAKLLAHGINYFAIGQNHSETLHPLFSGHPLGYRLNRLYGIDTQKKADRKNAATRKTLHRELEANKSERFIISGEDLVTLSMDGITRMRDELAPFAKAFRVIVYVRDPFAYINSAFQERLRNGENFEQIAAAPLGPGYVRIGQYNRVFGRDNVDIRLFEPERFPDGDLMADFLGAIGVDTAVGRELEVVRANEALSAEAAYLLNEIQRNYPGDRAGHPNPKRAGNIVQLLRGVPGEPFRCPPETFAAIAPLIERQLGWLRKTLKRNVFRDHPGDWDNTPRWSDETMAAVALLINDLAKRAGRK
jgi:hypothetical protein